MKESIALKNSPYILYADDDPDDQAIITETLKNVDPSLSLYCMSNGQEVLHFLGALNRQERLPCCIILDMNMPLRNGIETLRAIRDQLIYNGVPVFIFSTSVSKEDIDLSISLGAEAFITKPYGQKEIYSVCEEFADYTLKPAQFKKDPSAEKMFPA